MASFEMMLKYLDSPLREVLEQLPKAERENITELRLRRDRPLAVTHSGKSRFVSEEGALLSSPENAFSVTAAIMENTLFALSGYSVQSSAVQLIHGFLSAEGGRTGAVGKASSFEDRVTAVSEVSSLNIRLAAAKNIPLPGEAKELIEKQLPSFLVAGPPLSGKTTFLKSALSLLADRLFLRIAVIDERGEFFEPPGAVTADYLRFYPRKQAIDIAVRTLSPQYLICDEVGFLEDGSGLFSAGLAGVRVAASAHGRSFAGLLEQKNIRGLIERELFDYIFLLGDDPVGSLKGIYEGKGEHRALFGSSDDLSKP